MKVILASSSPRRKKIISRLGIQFKTLTPTINEPKYNNEESPKKYSEKLSKMKAESIYEKCTDQIVIGADTIVVLDENIVLEKPNNKQVQKNALPPRNTQYYDKNQTWNLAKKKSQQV